MDENGAGRGATGTRKIGPAGSLLSRPEGVILLLGLVLGLLYLIWLGLLSFASPGTFQTCLGMTATHVLFGRAAGMSFGYAMGLKHAMVLPVNLIIESVMVLLFFPLMVFSMQQLEIIPSLKKFTSRIQAAAEANHHLVRRYGIPGLFLFVCFPFWMTGPLVGCIIGHLMGMGPWFNVAIVLGGTALASAAWALFLGGLHESLARYTPYGPMILVLIFVAIAIGAYFLERSNRRNTG